MTSNKLDQAIQFIQTGNNKAALPILSKIIQSEPNNEAAWLWLHVCVDNVTQKRYCLQKALTINPNNQNARNTLESLSIKEFIPSTLQTLGSSAHSQPHKQAQQASNDRVSSSFRLSIIIGAVVLVMVGIIAYFYYTAATQTKYLIMERVVDGYLTAIEKRDWAVAYDYLCPEIKVVVLTPEDMARLILKGMGYSSLPNSHDFLEAPESTNLVRFSLSGINWGGGPYEARIDETSLKVCGVGKANGDLRHLLLPGTPPLNIAP